MEREHQLERLNFRRYTLHDSFIIMLERLRPRREFWPLLEGVLTQVWQSKQQDGKARI